MYFAIDDRPDNPCLRDMPQSRWKLGKTPLSPGRRGGSRILRGLMLRVGKIFWAHADV